MIIHLGTDRATLGGITLMRQTFAWTSDANGNATMRCDGREGPLITGLVDRIVTRPDANAAPTDNYDITLEDDYGGDCLNGAGADRDTATVERAYVQNVVASIRQVSTSTSGGVWLRVQNAGASKSGELEIYLLTRASGTFGT